jgi:hypothetical protein
MSDPIYTLEDMRRAGYKFLSHAVCKGCSADIEWWQTNNGKNIPFNPMPKSDQDETTPHWASCPKAKDFKPGGKSAPAAKPAPQPSLQAEINRLREATDARVIVALLDGRQVAAWRNGLQGEDLRHELITAANGIRNHIEKDGQA